MIILKNHDIVPLHPVGNYYQRRLRWRQVWSATREWWEEKYPKKEVVVEPIEPYPVHGDFFTRFVAYGGDSERILLRNYDLWYCNRHVNRNYTQKKIVQMVRRLR